MKPFLQAPTFLSVLLLRCSASVYGFSPFDAASTNIVSLAGSTGNEFASITFNIPCKGCAIDNDDRLELTLHVRTAQSECLTDTVFINGVPLVAVDQRLLKFPSRLSDYSQTQEITANVHLNCVNYQASLISVSILSADNPDGPQSLPGFTASFTQLGQPRILRLEPTPYAYSEEEVAGWPWPETMGKLAVLETSASSLSTVEGLEKEIRKLDLLRSHLNEMQRELGEQEARVIPKWRSDSSKCSSVKCYFRTVLRIVPGLARLDAAHFRRHSYAGDQYFQNALDTKCSDSHEQLLAQPDKSGLGPDELDDFNTADEVQLPEEANDNQPPFPPSHKGYEYPSDLSTKPQWYGHDYTLDSHGSQYYMPALSSRQLRCTLLVGAMIGLLIVLLFTACLFTCIKHRARIFCDPRRRAEMMALREEWLTKRAYRKAACQHRWRTFVRGIWRAKQSEEEEKQAMLVGTFVRGIWRARKSEEEKQAILEEQDDFVINPEIRNLRAAHRLVGDMMRAEQGESTFTASSSTTLSQSESLPSYTSAPPEYRSGQEGDISVIDGFTGYTPSNTDDTPESSVMDCSPRMSFETQRTS